MEYFQATQKDWIHVIQFTQALSEIIPDIQHRNASQQSFQSPNPTNLTDTIAKNMKLKK